MAGTLPEFVPPMLAKPGEPFDSDEHRFEPKWDGTRALAFVEGSGLRLRNRNRRDSLLRYPELGFLHELPAGLVLDGEIVVLRGERPDFRLMLKREQARDDRRAHELARQHPATYVVFDLLYRDFEPRTERPLSDRLAELEEVLEGREGPHLVRCQGVEGGGLHFFEEMLRLDLEGMVAKRLNSPYQPGRRTGAWTKVKRAHLVHCAIVGYLTDERGDVRSLVVATDDEDGHLRCVGRVGSGLDEATRAELRRILPARTRATPIVEADGEGTWVEPGLYCTVSYLERTKTGLLRAPVFRELIVDPG